MGNAAVFDLITPRSNCNFPYCQLYNSYNDSSENLVLDQLFIPKLIFFFILITYLVNIALIFQGEILSWSLMGVQGLSDQILRPRVEFQKRKQRSVFSALQCRYLFERKYHELCVKKGQLRAQYNKDLLHTS